MPFVFFVVIAGYLAAFFPFAYFRHDDWQIIGSAVHATNGWRYYFEPTIWEQDGWGIWFFRPFFKGIAVAGFRTFGLNHYGWFLFQFAAWLGGLWALARFLEEVTGSRDRAMQFACLSLAFWPFHMGSLLWVGEGLMNCPQLLAQGLCLLSLARFEKTRRLGWYAAALGIFAFSLLIKEAAVFLVALIGALFLTEAPWARLDRKAQAARLLPFAAVAAVYLIWRLGFVPMNPGYAVNWGAAYWGKPLALFGSTFAAALVVWWLAGPRPAWEGVRKRWLYVPFLAVSLAPYFGHPFVSPGWLLVPGTFWFLLLCLVPREAGDSRTFNRAVMVCCVLGLALGVYRLRRMDWWRWGTSQREFIHIVQSLESDRVREVQMELCANPDYPEATPSRLFGGEAHLQMAMDLIQDNPARLKYLPCGTADPGPVDGVVRLRWSHPDLVRVH